MRDNTVGSELPRGKDCSERRSRNDPGWTGTEKTLKAKLMNQFRRTGEGPGAPNQAYLDSPLWCSRCSRWMKDYGSELCARCRKDDYK